MKRIRALLVLGALIAAPAGAQFVSDAEPFLQAISDRDADKANELIASRPTVVNKHNSKGQTALNIAIARSDSLWTRFLIGRGADPNLADKRGDTPLITAARVGFTDAVELLLAVGARVDSANKMGETALIVAVQHSQLPIVKMLIDKGANPDKTDSAQGFSAREYAKRNTRERGLLEAIEAGARKPKSDRLDDFKLEKVQQASPSDGSI